MSENKTDEKEVLLDKFQIKFKTYIDFEIIKNSNPEALATEFKYLIGLGQFINVWSKTESLLTMKRYIDSVGLTEYIWDYKIKDESYYSSVDFLIDNNKKLVDLFKRNNKYANYVERIN